jgi:hypothetical protein
VVIGWPQGYSEDESATDTRSGSTKDVVDGVPGSEDTEEEEFAEEFPEIMTDGMSCPLGANDDSGVSLPFPLSFFPNPKRLRVDDPPTAE